MAETKLQNAPSERQQTQPATQQGQRGLARREGLFPRDLFTMSPFSMMRRLSEEMDRAFASSFGLGPRISEFGAWSPAIEVRERNNNLEIDAELPGLSKDDVKVECTAEGLILQGEKKREIETEEGGMHRSERSYGHFYRLIPLPEGVEPDKAKADFKDGVLHIKVPFSAERGKRRQIPIGT
ncbi:MAG TPA: Hsp20/alpha crystallin family protein [Bryobacteraceae bacterium]|nr:Hsp20/alpha crystallin family protein [Bryobacteraceae bacterium]